MAKGQQDWPLLIVGIGQGNGADPPIWVAVGTPLFKALMEDGFVAMFIGALSSHQQSLAGFGFGDDMDPCINDPTNMMEVVENKMQQSLNLWVGLLCAMGGALVPKKCFWYLLDLKWESGKWIYVNHQDRFKLKIPDNTGEEVTLPLLPASKACRTLTLSSEWECLNRTTTPGEYCKYLTELDGNRKTDIFGSRV